MGKLRALLALASVTITGVATASETVTYSYDSKVRLIKVVHTGTVNNNLTTNYAHDKADDRTNATTTGAAH